MGHPDQAGTHRPLVRNRYSCDRGSATRRGHGARPGRAGRAISGSGRHGRSAALPRLSLGQRLPGRARRRDELDAGRVPRGCRRSDDTPDRLRERVRVSHDPGRSRELRLPREPQPGLDRGHAGHRRLHRQRRVVTTALLDHADELFAALAEPNRRLLLEHLGAHGAATATALAAELPVTRQAVAQHLAVLESVALVSSARAGRERRYTVHVEPLTAAASWMNQVAARWDARLEAIKALAESPE